ncbi:stress protein [Wenjunlia vitaminophila]|uniref:Stress protein n=1 Tax=Wenjunlia vitaminophila TaxID=76728 RepID=A0A0T6LM13_WENVI|nr:TerD family protein [Wenjunlia vitaminophila]KRV47110.1 stress protein [Wenjunlia vitaminophila]
MAREFQRGHKAKISDLTAGTDLYVGVLITAPGLTFDISCFGLDADERLSDDQYFIFFNQPQSPEGSIQQLGEQAGDTQSFRVTLDRIPAQIHRLSFTATIDGNGQMSQIGPGYIRLVAGGEEVARYPFNGSEFTTERAVMLGDIYRKDVWRFAAVGQGFDGGLDALLKNFGGEVAEEQPAAPAQTPSFAPPGGPAPGFAPPPAPAPVPPPAPAPAFGAPQAPTIPQQVAPVATSPGAPVAPPFGQPVQPPGAVSPPGVPEAVAPPGAPLFGQVPGQQPPGVPGQFPSPGGSPQVAQVPAQPGVQAALQPHRETPVTGRWGLQNHRLVRAQLQAGGPAVLARQGSMVLYQGKVDFSRKSTGILGRAVGNATGQELELMRCTGKGQVFLAEDASHLHPIELQGDAICVSAENVLAFDESLQFEVRRIEGHGIPGGALFTMQFSGTGTVVVKTHGTPVVLPVTPTTYADSNAIVAWSAASQVMLSSQVRLRRTAYPGHSGETVNLQFRGAPGNFIVVQPYEV